MEYSKYRLSFALSGIVMGIIGFLIAQRSGTWLWYGALPLSILLIPVLYQPRWVERALAGKMVADMIFIVASLFHGNLSKEIVFVILFFTAVIYFWVNLQGIKKRYLQFVIMIYLLIPAMYATWKVVMGAPYSLLLTAPVSLLFAGLSYVFFESRQVEERRREETFLELKKRYNMADGSLRLVNFKQGLLIHDCRNILNRTAKIEIAALKGQCPADLARDMAQMRDDLLEKLESMRRLESVRFYPAHVLGHMYRHMPPRSESFSVLVPEGLQINFRQNLFESLAFNFAQNAWEAYSQFEKDPSQFRFEVSWGQQSLVFRDNAGGFDPSTIQMGHSTKETGQGRFLATLLENSRELDMKLSLDRWEKGMAIRMEFPTELISSD